MTTNTTTQYLDRGEGRIAYDVTGSGPLVVAVPGMGDLRSSYRHLAPALVDAGFRVATMDLRGHGDSDTTFSRLRRSGRRVRRHRADRTPGRSGPGDRKFDGRRRGGHRRGRAA